MLLVWRTLELVSVFALPQLIGILLWYRLRWAPRWIAAVAAALAPAVVFFWVGKIYLFAGLREHYAQGRDGCGMPVMAAVLGLLAGTAIELVLGVFTQVALFAWRRRRAVAS